MSEPEVPMRFEVWKISQLGREYLIVRGPPTLPKGIYILNFLRTG